MTNCLTVSIISLTSFCFLSGFSVRICVQWPYYGVRRQNYCDVDLEKNYSNQLFLYADAVKYCREHGGFVNSSALRRSDFAVLKITDVSSSGADEIPGLSGRRLRASDLNCANSSTTRSGCKVVCAFKSCPVGRSGFPECQTSCRCVDVDRCDIITGLCMGTNCTPGFFGPPACRKCNCDSGFPCNKETGECPFGCKNGWRGKSCQQRSCRGGRCPRLTRIEDKNCTVGTQGNNCTKPVCPQGFYNPPACSMPCHCLYVEFCDRNDGDCAGTPCQDSRTGRKCEIAGCPLMRFGVPDCGKFCFCRDSQPCEIEGGKCPIGCRPGWSGGGCNQRLCPTGRYRYPACDMDCNCKKQTFCNSLSGACEVFGCADGREHSTNCTKQTTEAPDPHKGESSAYSKFSAIALVFGTVVVVFAVCVHSMTHTKESPFSRRSTMATSGVPSSDSSSSIPQHRKSRMSYIQMDNRHLSISTRDTTLGGTSTPETVHMSGNATPTVFRSSCVDNIGNGTAMLPIGLASTNQK